MLLRKKTISEPLLARNKHTGVMLEAGSGAGCKLCVHHGSPTSERYVYPPWYDDGKEITSWSLSKWMEEVHARRGWAPAFPQIINMKHAKGLLEEYSGEELIRVIHDCAIHANHPFSFAFVRRKARENNE
jgi:hypothetical protein